MLQNDLLPNIAADSLRQFGKQVLHGSGLYIERLETVVKVVPLVGVAEVLPDILG